MKILRGLIIVSLFVFLISGFAWAADPSKAKAIDPKTIGPVAKEGEKAMLPDLIVESIQVSPSAPKVGDTIGPIVVTIKNQGNAFAPSNITVIGCAGQNCFPINCPSCLHFTLATSTPGIGWSYTWMVPSIEPGKSMKFTFNPVSKPSAGPPLQEKWQEGQYLFLCNVDRDKTVTESNEENNKKELVIKVPSKLPGLKK